MNTTAEFKVGQSVLWRGGWGNEPEEPARIVGIGEKNDRTVYDLDNGHWAYEEQLQVNESEVKPPKKSFTVPVFFTIHEDGSATAREMVVSLMENTDWDEPSIETICIGNLEEVKPAEDGIKVSDATHDALLDACRDIELRMTQATIASSIGPKKNRTPFLLSELERMKIIIRTAIDQAK